MRNFRAMPSVSAAGSPVDIPPGAQPQTILSYSATQASIRPVAYVAGQPLDRGPQPMLLHAAGPISARTAALQ
jgi:hypothetical protein